MKYSFKKGLNKMIEALIEFGLPFLVVAIGNIKLSDGTIVASLTVGAILRGIVNYIKVRRKTGEK